MRLFRHFRKSNVALSGGSKLATALSLNICPYRAILVLHRGPRVLSSIEVTTILTQGGPALGVSEVKADTEAGVSVRSARRPPKTERLPARSPLHH